jgi:outer membrane immunogenic protein
MKNLFMLTVLAVLLASVLPAVAQDDITRFEASGGYDYARFNVNDRINGVSSTETFNGNGGGGQFEYNANSWIGTVAELGGFGVTSTTNGALVGGVLTYLFGPRVNFRHGKAVPFAQALFGGVRTTDGIIHSGPENHFAMTVGGGIDFKVSKLLSVRPVQAEYFMTTIPDGLDNRQNNFRLSAGVVFRFGRA